MGFTVKTLNLKKLKKKGKQKLFVVPYFFTFANAIFGLLSVIQTFEGNFIGAAYFIVLAAIMDLIDGKLARAFGSTSYLGTELDSLCDAISFCFAPAILLYSMYFKNLGLVGVFVLSLYLCCGLLRLAKFNISSATQVKDITYFVGLPTTVSAFLLAQIVINSDWISIQFFWFLQNPFLFTLFIAAIALLMISPVRFPSFKKINPRLLIGAIVVILIAISIGLMYGFPVIFFSLFAYVATFVFSFFVCKIIGLLKGLS